jgi:hypothetical protein
MLQAPLNEMWIVGLAISEPDAGNALLVEDTRWLRKSFRGGKFDAESHFT